MVIREVSEDKGPTGPKCGPCIDKGKRPVECVQYDLDSSSSEDQRVGKRRGPLLKMG